MKGTRHIYTHPPAVLQVSSTAEFFRASVSPGKHHSWRCGSHLFISVCTMALFLHLHFSVGDVEPWETKYFGFFLHFGALLLLQMKTEAFLCVHLNWLVVMKLLSWPINPEGESERHHQPSLLPQGMERTSKFISSSYTTSGNRPGVSEPLRWPKVTFLR